MIDESNIMETLYILYPSYLDFDEAVANGERSAERVGSDCCLNCYLQDLLMAIEMSGGNKKSLKIHMTVKLNSGESWVFDCMLIDAISELKEVFFFAVDEKTLEWAK